MGEHSKGGQSGAGGGYGGRGYRGGHSGKGGSHESGKKGCAVTAIALAGGAVLALWGLVEAVSGALA